MCELGERNNLVLESFIGVQEGTGWRVNLLAKVSPALTRFGLRSELFARTMIYEFKKVDA